MSTRVQVVLSMEERERFRAAAAAQGLSLSTWLREAGHRRAAGQESPVLRTAQDVRRFFDALADDGGQEPDWEDHKRLIAESRRRALPDA